MFDISLPLIGGIVIWGLFFYASITKNNRGAKDLSRRIFSWLGVTLMAGSLFQPWIRLDASEYISNALWGVVKELLPGALAWGGIKGPAKLIDLILNEATVNAITTSTALAVVLKAHVWVIWALYGFIVMTFFLLLTTAVSHTIACKKWVDIFLFLLTLPMIVSFARFLPLLDALGDQTNLGVAIIGALLGAHIGNGPIIALVGMALILINSLIVIADNADSACLEQTEAGI